MRKLSILVLVAMLVSLFGVPIVGAQDEMTDYEVKGGDVLWRIGEAFGVPYLEIVEATNGAGGDYAFIEDPDLIEIGWKLRVPGKALPYASIESPTYPDASTGGTLIYGVWQSFGDNIDPHQAVLQVTAQADKTIFDSLVYMRRGDLTVYPGLAIDWTISSDVKTYVFTLREDVTFHDGTPFNAEAVKYNFDWVADPDNLPGNSPTVLGPYESTEVIDEYTVQVNFTDPNAAFLPNLAQMWLSMGSPTAKEKWGDEYQFHLTGTGPFMLEEYVAGERISVVRNPDYNWGPPYFHEGPAYLDGIEFRAINEDSTRIAALETGEIHMMDRVPTVDLARMTANPDLQILDIEAGGMPWTMQINVIKPPTDELAVRKALFYATNQELMVDTLFKGTLSPAHWLSEVPMPGYDAEKDAEVTYNPELAKEWLEEAGWVDTDGDGIREKDGQRLVVQDYLLADFGMDEFTVMQQQMYADVGIELEILVLEVAAGVEAWNNAEHNMDPAFFWWPDPGFNRLWYDSGNIGTCCNWSHYNNPEMDALILEGEAALDPADRDAIYHKIYELALEDVAQFPLFHKRYVGATADNIGGISFDITGYPDFNDAHFVK